MFALPTCWPGNWHGMAGSFRHKAICNGSFRIWICGTSSWIGNMTLALWVWVLYFVRACKGIEIVVKASCFKRIRKGSKRLLLLPLFTRFLRFLPLTVGISLSHWTHPQQLNTAKLFFGMLWLWGQQIYRTLTVAEQNAEKCAWKTSFQKNLPGSNISQAKDAGVFNCCFHSWFRYHGILLLSRNTLQTKQHIADIWYPMCGSLKTTGGLRNSWEIH